MCPSYTPNAATLRTHSAFKILRRSIPLTAFMVACAIPVCAEPLQQLEVTVLTISSDRTALTLDVPFHLHIHAHTTQTIDRLYNLILPDLAPFEVIGDERHLQPAGGGTDYDETITLKAKRVGTFEVPPVTLNAINSKTMQPSAFSSVDKVVLHVKAAASSRPGVSAADLARYAGFAILAIVVGILAIRISGTFMRWAADIFQSLPKAKPRPEPVPEPVYVAPAVAIETVPAVQRLRSIVNAIAREPRVEFAEEVRDALRSALAAGEEETLADILARIPTRDRGVLDRALRAAERAAFIDVRHRRTALEEGLPLFELACQRLEHA